MSAGDDVAWCGAELHQVDRDDCIDSLTSVSVILAHADPAMAAVVDDAVCESPVAIARDWRQRCRLTLARAKPIKPAIREIRKIEDAKRDCPRATTIFVHRVRTLNGFGTRSGVLAPAPLARTTTLRPCSCGRASSQ